MYRAAIRSDNKTQNKWRMVTSERNRFAFSGAVRHDILQFSEPACALLPLHHLMILLYREERNHRSLANRIIEPGDEVGQNTGEIECRERLCGILRYHYRDAA